jgi:hypothetical protein
VASTNRPLYGSGLIFGHRLSCYWRHGDLGIPLRGAVRLIYRWLADAVLVLHLGFVLFVVLGGLVVLRWPRIAWLHLPAATWGVLIEYTGWICPLTPLENSFRMRGGETGYSGSFIQQYIQPTLYPAGLTRPMQLALGSVLLILNLAAYGAVMSQMRRTPPGGD